MAIKIKLLAGLNAVYFLKGIKMKLNKCMFWHSFTYYDTIANCSHWCHFTPSLLAVAMASGLPALVSYGCG